MILVVAILVLGFSFNLKQIYIILAVSLQACCKRKDMPQYSEHVFFVVLVSSTASGELSVRMPREPAATPVQGVTFSVPATTCGNTKRAVSATISESSMVLVALAYWPSLETQLWDL